MKRCAKDFVREMQGFRGFWRKKRHPLKSHMNQPDSRETLRNRASNGPPAAVCGNRMTAVHNRIARPASLQALRRLGEPVS